MRGTAEHQPHYDCVITKKSHKNSRNWCSFISSLARSLLTFLHWEQRHQYLFIVIIKLIYIQSAHDRLFATELIFREMVLFYFWRPAIMSLINFRCSRTVCAHKQYNNSRVAFLLVSMLYFSFAMRCVVFGWRLTVHEYYALTVNATNFTAMCHARRSGCVRLCLCVRMY